MSRCAFRDQEIWQVMEDEFRHRQSDAPLYARVGGLLRPASVTFAVSFTAATAQ
jgi:hypothetical protein